MHQTNLDQAAQLLINDLVLHAELNLRIFPKAGGESIPLRFNRAQRYIHDSCEDQKKRTGKVRKVILKGRQQGSSTYVGARYYHRTAYKVGQLTFIFAHDADASASLFGMVKNYYDLSDPSFRPSLGAKNHNELLFPRIKSGYKVGTAGTSGLGRSKTIQNLHWSEVAYSPNAIDHGAGILQAVADVPGTEIILESTANGEGDYYHQVCMQAISGVGEFELIFVPWYWQPEYTKPLSDNFIMDEDEVKYLDIYSKDGLTKEHLCWRRAKIADFGGETIRFKREYPFTPEEAFEVSNDESYIQASLIRAARNNLQISTNAPMVFGVDPAALGKDSFKVCHRKGPNVLKIDTYPKGYPHDTARRLARDIDNYHPAIVNIDCGGLGIGVYGCMLDMGYGHIVKKVDFGGRSIDPDINFNITAELFRSAKEWLEDGPVSITCDNVSASAIQAQLSSRKHQWRNNSQLKIEPKADFKARFKASPDDADAFLLTFATPLANNAIFGANKSKVITLNTSFNPFG